MDVFCPKFSTFAPVPHAKSTHTIPLAAESVVTTSPFFTSKFPPNQKPTNRGHSTREGGVEGVGERSIVTAMSWLSSLTDVAKNAEALLNSVDAKAKEVAVVTNQVGALPNQAAEVGSETTRSGGFCERVSTLLSRYLTWNSMTT